MIEARRSPPTPRRSPPASTGRSWKSSTLRIWQSSSRLSGLIDSSPSTPPRDDGEVADHYLLPDTHCPHGTCQSPKPSYGLRSGPPVLVLMTTSPFFT